MSANGKLYEADVDTLGAPKTTSTRTADLITAAKLEHWDDQAEVNARLVELSKKQQDAQQKLQAMQQEAQQRLQLKAALLNASLEAVNREVQQLTADFQQREAERNAYIKALEKTAGTGNDGRNDPT